MQCRLSIGMVSGIKNANGVFSYMAGSGFYGEGRMLKILEPQAFDVELQSSPKPFVVAFLKRNERYRNQSQTLDEVSKHYDGKVRCYLYDADYLDTAMDRFMVKGTPTFLLFAEGREVDRLIGESDQETLDEFIGNFMLSR